MKSEIMKVKTKWRKAKGLRYCVMKSQSAMEYLMTYGWAILIIAVVLGALFQLGVFNSMTFAPKAPPGACQVFRPNGPGTTSFINLEGICNGEIPQFVTQFSGSSSYVSVPNSAMLNPTNALTYTAWVYITTGGLNQIIIDKNWGNAGGEQILVRTSEKVSVNAGTNGADAESTSALPLNQWVFVVGTASANGVSVYFDSINNGSTTTAPTLASNSLALGIGGGGGGSSAVFNGDLADIQIYNTSLSQAEITALYDEGIGGAPIRLQNLVGWWPLNGNANDYSGNNNNGNAISVTYTTDWYSGYSVP